MGNKRKNLKRIIVEMDKKEEKVNSKADEEASCGVQFPTRGKRNDTERGSFNSRSGVVGKFLFLDILT